MSSLIRPVIPFVPFRPGPKGLFALLLSVGTLCSALLTSCKPAESPRIEASSKVPDVPKTVTFNKDVAPILFANCSYCHRPGQAAPFPLLTYADARKRARQIAEVTAKRYMPPWLPAHGYGDFADDRTLSDRDIQILQNWFAAGAPEGEAKDLRPPPQWTTEWQLGQPDLIVEADPFTLPAEGQDVYFNFVTPIPVSGTRFVKGIEFRPGNAKVVHHAFVQVDQTRESRRRAVSSGGIGFPGMDLPESAVMPGGHLLGWQPGKVPYLSESGLAWILRTNTDLVLQVHMNPSGRTEMVKPSVGFYFTDQPPTNSPFRIKLAALNLDIPAGTNSYVAEQSYTLPVDVSLVRVGAHAHYLGKDLQAFAILPNGEERPLLRIRDWDFKWQGDYKYAAPVNLPKGTRLMMRFTYDNSSGNPRNPHNPPQRVLYGLQTTDEMGELFFQAVTHSPEDYVALAKNYSGYYLGVSIDFYRFRLKVNPNDSDAHARLGRALGGMGQIEPAMQHLAAAIRLNPENDLALFDVGMILLRQQRFDPAAEAFRKVVQINPQDGQAYGCLGIISLKQGRPAEAREFFEKALKINPDDSLAAGYLARLK